MQTMNGTTSLLVFLLPLLLSFFLTLATVTVSPESQQHLPCNSCCQGPVGSQGTPGIPGVPGTNGLPGSVGPRGERGESIIGEAGPRGEKGDIGVGLKGERGMVGLRGPPGKVGPTGVVGPAGSDGPAGIGTPGVKGQKGEMGSVLGSTSVSAFSAARSNSFTPSSNGQALPFDRVHTNVGDDFDGSSGRFTCDIPGIYLFAYSIMTSRTVIRVKLMKNQENINSVETANSYHYSIPSNTAVLQLTAGDQVWLKCDHSTSSIFSNDNLFTTFSGGILHEV